MSADSLDQGIYFLFGCLHSRNSTRTKAPKFLPIATDKWDILSVGLSLPRSLFFFLCILWSCRPGEEPAMGGEGAGRGLHRCRQAPASAHRRSVRRRRHRRRPLRAASRGGGGHAAEAAAGEEAGRRRKKGEATSSERKTIESSS
jgi:hypothetical protein